MDNVKQEAVKHHEDAAQSLEIAAKLHRDAAKQMESGNFPKAQTLSVSAAEADTEANLHASKASELYHRHEQELEAKAAEEASAEAARAAKKEAKAT